MLQTLQFKKEYVIKGVKPYFKYSLSYHKYIVYLAIALKRHLKEKSRQNKLQPSLKFT